MLFYPWDVENHPLNSLAKWRSHRRQENVPNMAPAPIPTAKPIMKPILTLSKQLGCACPYGPTATGIFLLWTDLNKNTHAFRHQLMLFVCDQKGLFYLLIWLAYYIVYLHDKLGLGAGMVFQENGMFQDRDSCIFTGKVWVFLILALFPPSRSKYLLGTKKKKKKSLLKLVKCWVWMLQPQNSYVSFYRAVIHIKVNHKDRLWLWLRYQSQTSDRRLNLSVARSSFAIDCLKQDYGTMNSG